ncbi:MAG: hypothetical protein KTR33_11450 [Gammaproteobacteria bacterium]|nr:hypothetical protein [Gammaproteobacteria bacterium]
MELAVLLGLWALMMVSCTTLVLLRRLSERVRTSIDSKGIDYVSALERQIKENNRDISILSNRLAVAEGQSEDPRLFALSGATDDSSQLHEISSLESRLRERDQQISWLHMDLAKFQKQRELMIKKDRELGRQSAELEKLRRELNLLKAQTRSS